MADKNDTAQLLADAHFQMDEAITRIFRVLEPDEADGRKPVKLLEVNPMTAETGVTPIGLTADPSRGVPFPTVIVEVSSDEFERLVSGELRLPRGWTLGPELFSSTRPARAAS
jgi:hypothetical protein